MSIRNSYQHKIKIIAAARASFNDSNLIEVIIVGRLTRGLRMKRIGVEEIVEKSDILLVRGIGAHTKESNIT
jgi:hypothetical protein